MKYMILTYASQEDFDGMAGQATSKPAWQGEDFGKMGAFMEAFVASWLRLVSWSRPAG